MGNRRRMDIITRMKEYKNDCGKKNLKNGTIVRAGTQNRGLAIFNVLKMVHVFFCRRN